MVALPFWGGHITPPWLALGPDITPRDSRCNTDSRAGVLSCLVYCLLTLLTIVYTAVMSFEFLFPFSRGGGAEEIYSCIYSRTRNEEFYLMVG